MLTHLVPLELKFFSGRCFVMIASGLKGEILHELEIRDISPKGRRNGAIFMGMSKL
jgi:hypothetical protein